MSVRSTLTDLNTALESMPEANRQKAIELISAVCQLALKTAGIPPELSEAMEAVVMTLMVKVKTSSQSAVVALVMQELTVLPHVKAVARAAGLVP